MLTATVMRRNGGALIKRISRAGLAMVDQGIVSLCNFLSIYLLARIMSPSDFGVLMLAQTVILFGTGVHNALIVEPQAAIGSSLIHREYASLLRALFRLHVWVALGLGFVILAGGMLLPNVGGHPALLMELSLVTAAWLAQEFVRRAMYVRSDTPGALVNDAACYLLQLGGVGALVTWGGRSAVSVESALAVFGTSSAIAALLGAVQLRRRYREAWMNSGWQQEARHWRTRVWHLGKWLIGKNVVGWFGGNGHAWVVAALLGTEAVGVYRAAIHLINVINPLRLAYISYLSPRGSRTFHLNGQYALSRWVRRAGLMSVGSLLPIVLVLIFFPGTILHLAYGNKFSGLGLGLILSLATVGQVVMFSKFPFDVALTAMSQTRWLFIISLAPVVLLFTVGVALIHGLGLLGVPLSALVISISVWSATYLTYRRLVRGRTVRGGQEVTPL